MSQWSFGKCLLVPSLLASASLLTSWSAADPADPSSTGGTLAVTITFKQVGFHPGARSDIGTYFVVLTLDGVANEQSQREVLNLSRNLCREKSVCFVHYWSSPTNAAHSLPMTDEQAEAEIASYNKNIHTGNDALVCHPFGAPGDRCA